MKYPVLQQTPSLLTGPQSLSRNHREQILRDVVEHIKKEDRLLGIGLYGSMAREEDHSYSDIELFCVFSSGDPHTTHEWLQGALKIKVHYYEKKYLLRQAQNVDYEWSLSHNKFFDAKPLYGPPGLFYQLKEEAYAQPWAHFKQIAAQLIIGEIYEGIAKLRNLAETDTITAYLPTLTIRMAEFGAFALGLVHKKCYSTRHQMLSESLRFSPLPDGYPELCQTIMDGKLTSRDRITQQLETFWKGIVEWAEQQAIPIDSLYGSPIHQHVAHEEAVESNMQLIA